MPGAEHRPPGLEHRLLYGHHRPDDSDRELLRHAPAVGHRSGTTSRVSAAGTARVTLVSLAYVCAERSGWGIGELAERLREADLHRDRPHRAAALAGTAIPGGLRSGLRARRPEAATCTVSVHPSLSDSTAGSASRAFETCQLGFTPRLSSYPRPSSSNFLDNLFSSSLRLSARRVRL